MQKCGWASNFLAQRRLRTSHTLRDLSSDAETRYLPCGWKTTPLTQLSWPSKVNRQIPRLTSHTYNKKLQENQGNECSSSYVSYLGESCEGGKIRNWFSFSSNSSMLLKFLLGCFGLIKRHHQQSIDPAT